MRWRGRSYFNRGGIVGVLMAVSLSTALEPAEEYSTSSRSQELNITMHESAMTPYLAPRSQGVMAHEQNIQKVKKHLKWRGVWGVSRNTLQNTATILDYTHIALGALTNLGNFEQTLRRPLHGLLMAMVVVKMVHEKFNIMAERRISQYNVSVSQLIQDHRYFRDELQALRMQYLTSSLSETSPRLSSEGLSLSYQENYENLQTTEEMIDSLKKQTACEKRCYQYESFFWKNTSVIYEIGEFACGLAELALLATNFILHEGHSSYTNVAICAVVFNVLCVYLGNLKGYAEKISQERAHAMIDLEEMFEDKDAV